MDALENYATQAAALVDGMTDGMTDGTGAEAPDPNTPPTESQ